MSLLRSLLNALHELMALLPRWTWWVFAALCAVAIIYVGTRPGSDLPPTPFLFPHQDKLLHFLGYSIFASLVFRAVYPFEPDVQPCWRRPWLPVILLPLALGALDEFLQSFVPGRSSELGDVVADGMAGVAVLLVGLTLRRKARRPL